MRVFESECIYCGCSAVLNNYCRQCESCQPAILIAEDSNAPSHDSDDYDDEFHESDTDLDTRPDSPD